MKLLNACELNCFDNPHHSSFSSVAKSGLPIFHTSLQRKRWELFFTIKTLFFVFFQDIKSTCISTNTCSILILRGVLKSYDPNSFISGTFDFTRAHYHTQNYRWSWSIFVKIHLHHPTIAYGSIAHILWWTQHYFRIQTSFSNVSDLAWFGVWIWASRSKN